ncbi:MAG: ABC transporter substrate-binding protein [Ramlibacter sp.]|jgi:sulfonate transport system substrate-binding protein
MNVFKPLLGLALSLTAGLALALGPAPAPLKDKATLTVGYVKVGHLSPMLMVEEELRKMNIEVKRAEFVRYADARTALLSNSVDVSAVGPGDLAIVAAQGSKNLIGLTGVGSSPKYLVVRKGVKIEDWSDLAGKKIAIAPGSAVWFQWAMTMIERNIPYNTFTPVNVQGGGTAFVQAMKRGDIDAMVLWEPFESQAVAEGDAVFAQKLEYSQSRAVGAELGMLAASGEAMAQKKELVRRFLWAYLKAEETLAKNREAFADAYAKYTGLPLNVTRESAKIIKLGGVLNKEQVTRLAEAAFKQGIVQKDVAREAAALYDDSLAIELKK